MQPQQITAPPALAGPYKATVTVEWARVTAAVSGNVVFAGQGRPARTGVPEDPYLATPSGKIVLITRGSCDANSKADRAARAGARAVLLGLVSSGDPISFSRGGGTQFVPTLDTGAAAVQLAGNEVDGHIMLRDQGRTLAVPWHILPRKSSAVQARGGRSLTAPIHLFNAGAAGTTAQVFALTGTSPRVPNAELPAPGSNLTFTDLRAVGARLVEPGIVQFGVSTFGQRSNTLYSPSDIVDIDTNRDGVPDFAVRNEELDGHAASGCRR